MSRKQPDLMIDSLRLPLHAGAQIQQQYEAFGGFSMLRLGAGAAVHQETWRRTRTTLSATGLIPPGLQGQDWSQPFALGCVAPLSMQAASQVFALPAARRTDAAPFGFAVDASGFVSPVSASVAGDVATLSARAGALSYQVLWYPLLTVRAPAGVRASYDAAGAVASWELTCEEV